MSFETIIKAYKYAQDIGIKEFGLHLMSGSCVLDLSYWDYIVKEAFKIQNEIYQLFNIELKFINIGGGIGINYYPRSHNLYKKEYEMHDIANFIKSKFNENIEHYNLNFEPALYTENGRFITGKFGWLVAKNKVVKTTEHTKFYGLNASMANLMRPGMYGAYHHITVPYVLPTHYDRHFLDENRDDGEDVEDYELNDLTEKVQVVGTLCENNDFFAKNRVLPKNIPLNSIFVIHDTGAHSQSMGFNYNFTLKCAEILKYNGQLIKIRRAETFDDIINTII